MQQLGLPSSERNALEDTKRVVEQLKKNGAVDTLHSQALTALFQSETFKSEVRQWLKKRDRPASVNEVMDVLQEMSLSALAGLLSGTVDLQQQEQEQQQQQPHASTAGAAAGSHGALQSQPGGGRSIGGPKQQQQQLGGGGPSGGAQSQQQQQQSIAERTAEMRRRQQQKPQVCISEEVSLKLKVALMEMLETEEKYLQRHFKQCYSAHMDHLQHHKPFEPPEFTAEAPKNVRDTPLSPQVVYEAEDDDPSEQQHQQQHPTQSLLQQHLDSSLGALSRQRTQ